MELHVSKITEENRYKGGKSFRKYCFTLEDIARARGKSLSTVRRDKWTGKFDPKDLTSLARYIQDANNS